MAEADHSGSASPNQAILDRSTTYRSNGYQVITGSPAKQGAYSNLERIRSVLVARDTDPSPATVPKGSLQHARRYIFTYEDNYKIGSSPYLNEGHHMLPCEAFTDAYLTADQLELMRKVDYDVNNGENITFLPVSDRDCDFHFLPSHCGSHPRYTNLVSDDMQGIRDAIQGEIDRDPEHKNWSPPADIPQRLRALQDDYWNVLTACGPVKVNDVGRGARKSRALTRRRSK